MLVITPVSLKNIRFFQTDSGDWKFVENMTQEKLVFVSKQFGQHIKPQLNSPPITPPPSLLDQVIDLDECLYDLQATVEKLN